MFTSDRFGRPVRRVKAVVTGRHRKGADPIAESLAAAQLSFLHDWYLPWSASAISRQVAVKLCNELALNERRAIVEFGPGISTLVMAHWAQTVQVPISILAFEEDLGWLRFLQAQLEGIPFADVRLVHAPLRRSTREYPLPVQRWYDLHADELGSRLIDLVLVDGPSAYLRHNRFDRYPALPFVRERLTDNCAVVLDDTDRKGERAVVRAWGLDSTREKWQRTECGGATFWTRGRAFTT